MATSAGRISDGYKPRGSPAPDLGIRVERGLQLRLRIERGVPGLSVTLGR